MKIYKQIEIDLKGHAEQLQSREYNYTDEEKYKLRILYSYFADGRFDAAYKYVDTWAHEERELIPCEIWDVLYDISVGIKYKVENKK